MIPKIIHYCWFGKGEFPATIKSCIESWNILRSDYQIMLWNEGNFDYNSFDFSREAYEAGQYAFVSDFARFYALNKYGGIYLDTDIEVVKDFSELLTGDVVLSGDESGNLDGSFIAGEKGHPFFEEMLSMYENLHFLNEDGSYNQTVINVWMQEKLVKHGYTDAYEHCCLDARIEIYPLEYFCAMNQYNGKVCKTEKTYCIHHHTYSWTSKKTAALRFFRTRIIVPIIGIKRYRQLRDCFKGLLKRES